MDTEPQILSTSLLKIRCPKCLKLYAVNRAEMHETRPKFQCRACHEKFWVTAVDVAKNDEEVMGFPMDWLATTVDAPAVLDDRAYSCPKCGEPYSAGQHECTKCGLVFIKFVERNLVEQKTIPDEGISAPSEVKQAWDEVVARYDESSVHNKFIELANRYDCLDYAAKRYATILETCPGDDRAAKAQQEIIALTTTRFESRTLPEKDASSNWFERIDLFMRGMRFTSLVLILCGIVITMGVLLPSERNLVGIGSSVLFFILTLRYYFRVI